ncbi:DUF1365 domain-containing protein [Nocardioides sp. NPDC057767]|uniref:DUF1365 domain-containing protein n=1 Tax=unclassified Nocardioides TaxID=2615069 RepID=UPI00366DB808
MIPSPVFPEAPALVVGHVSHAREVPLRHSFRHRSYHWLIDVDDPPRLPFWLRPLAGFRVEDHLDAGASGRGVRGDLGVFLEHRGVDLAPTDRVLMLANARVLGHVFNPLTVYWVQSDDGVLRAVVFEVHNTYGERHAYLLDVDRRGRARTGKAFYVSPFNDLTGTYEIQLQIDPGQVAVTVGLDRDGARVLTATTRGTPEPATRRALVRVSLSHLLMPHRVSALIRFHGIWLWLRRLPVVPRPAPPKETTS